MPDIAALEAQLSRLNNAIARGERHKKCLRFWSDFVRQRDGYRCVDCGSTDSLSAHHICRKSFLAEAQFHTGNGITLCHRCHKEKHAAFNRRPDMSLPMDAEGGEKIDAMQCLYGLLCADARERELLRDDFYFLSDSVLARFKKFQGFSAETPFPGSRLEQAYLIWAQCPRNTLNALAAANGFTIPDGSILPGTVTSIFDEPCTDQHTDEALSDDDSGD